MATRLMMCGMIFLSYLLVKQEINHKQIREDYTWAIDRIAMLENASIVDKEKLLSVRERLHRDLEWRAIKTVESEFGLTSKNMAQITRICIDDVNRISDVKYSYADRNDPIKSREVYEIYVSFYGGDTFEKRARIWNGGPKGPSRKSTLPYWRKVEAAYERLLEQSLSS